MDNLSEKMPSAPLSTSERIIETSLKLFNEHGFQNVPLLRIATHMGMSSGNLAYHFKTKTDIVLAVFPLIEKALRERREPAGPFLPKSAVLHQVEVLDTLWRYRFFFNAITKLLSEDLNLRKRFFILQDTVINALQDLLDGLVRQKSMHPVPAPSSTRLLSKSIWMIWLSWLRFEQIDHPSRQTMRSEAVHDAIMLNWSVVQAYFPVEFAELVMAELREAIALREANEAKPARAGAKRASSGAPRAARKSRSIV